MTIGDIKKLKGKFQLIQTASLNNFFKYVELPDDYRFGYDAIKAAMENPKINGSKKIIVSLNEKGQYIGKGLFRINQNDIVKKL